MNKEEQDLLDYLYYQFPATVGHIPLKEKMRAIYQRGLRDAAAIVSNNIPVPTAHQGMLVTTILEAANKPL